MNKTEKPENEKSVSDSKENKKVEFLNPLLSFDLDQVNDAIIQIMEEQENNRKNLKILKLIQKQLTV